MLYKSDIISEKPENTVRDAVNNFRDPGLLRLKLESAKKFTGTYKENMNEHPAIIEAKCLAHQYPALCRGIVKGDLFAGRFHNFPMVGFGKECYLFHTDLKEIEIDDIAGDNVPEEVRKMRSRIGSSNTGFFFDPSALKDAKAVLNLDDREKNEIDSIMEFWWEENSRARFYRTLPGDVIENIDRTDFDLKLASSFFRVACCSVDNDKLLRNGIPGMRELIESKKASFRAQSPAAELYRGMLMALDVLVDVCKFYQEMALEMSSSESDPAYRAELLKMAEVLGNITVKKPKTTREALQLFWLYNLLTGTLNYGRMDEYMGDFYAGDIDSGRATDEEALKLLKSLWKMINDLFIDGVLNSQANNRIVLGGKARRNPENADRFAIIAMEASRQTYFAEPNLSLRFHKEQDKRLMDKALELISEGCIHPSLYNDDAFIPHLTRTMDIPEKEADYYTPQGCGEIMIEHRQISSPNALVNYLTLLDVVLHNGYYTPLGEQRGLKLGNPEDFDTFEKLLSAVKKQIDLTHNILAKRQAYENRFEADNIAYLFMSMLTDDCIEKGKSLMDGGTRYIGGLIESFGITNLADSLYAIKELVYEKKVMPLKKLVEIIDADFVGYEAERQMMLHLPKFGNDHQRVDALHTELTEFIHRSAAKQGEAVGIPYLFIVNLNPGGITYANVTKASADGRHYGEPMAVGNAPTAGRDEKGLTALLNSMLKHDRQHSGYVHNLKVSKTLFSSENRGKLESLLKTYFDNGGIQLMITTIDSQDLQNALKEPEKYSNLLVRVGGWTARYVELEPVYQMEILKRTMYGQ